MKTLIKEIDVNKPDKDLIAVFASMLASGFPNGDCLRPGGKCPG